MNSDKIVGYLVQAEGEIPLIFNIMWWLTEHVGKWSSLTCLLKQQPVIKIANRGFPAKLGYNRIRVHAVTPERFVGVADQRGSTSLLFLQCCAAHWCAPILGCCSRLSRASLGVELLCELCESGTNISHGWCTSGVSVISLTAHVVQWALWRDFFSY